MNASAKKRIHARNVAKAKRTSKARSVRDKQYMRNVQAQHRRLIAAGYVWVHTGGGTWIANLRGKFKSHPCDDSYLNLKTGKEVMFRTTKEAHFGGMPAKVKHLNSVARRKGVMLDKRFKANGDEK